MTISGIPSPLNDPRLTRSEERAGASVRDQSTTSRAATQAESRAVAEPGTPRSSARASGVVPAEAPPGTDPALWSVLTAEERSFFARAVTNGPLTYTRMMNQLHAPAAATLPRGGRMDVRV